MHFTSSTVLAVLAAASIAIQGSTAFVVPQSPAARGIALFPPRQFLESTKLYDQQPPAEDIAAFLVHETRLVKKVADATKALKELEHYDPEDDTADDETTDKVLELALFALEQLTDEELSKSVKLESTQKDKEESALESGIEIIKTLIKYRLEYAYEETIQFGTYPAHPEYPTVSLMGLPKMMVGPPPRYAIFAPKKIIRIVKRVVRNAVGNKLIGDKPSKLAEAGKAEEAFEALFSPSKLGKLGIIPNPSPLIPRPKHTLKTWEDDEEQGRQFLNGVNPVMIRVAQELGDFSEEIAQELGKDYLQQMIDDKRLFYVSYDELDKLEKNPHQAYPLPMNVGKPQDQPRYFEAAIAIFALSEDRKTLKPEAIQLDREPGAKVYTKSDKPEWLFAKAKLATADSQYHEWVSHLAMTHLVTEPHIVAIHNTLRKHNHKLYTFVKPLCKDTLLLNWGARLTLAFFGANSFGDKQSSVGVGQFMQLIQKKYQSYDFFKSSGLDTELESRGFTEDFDMPAYLYREDGMKLWNAYGKFASDFVDEVYESEADIASDDILQEWARETSYADKGAVPGFPTSFSDKVTLAKVLQTLMWTTSGLHCAVNFPQYDFFAYAPNKPLGARASVSEFPSDATEEEQRAWIFNSFMPKIDIAQNVIETASILTLPSYHTVNRLDKQFETIGTEAYKSFKKELDIIGDQIEKRNKENEAKGEAVYSYLHPDVVSASIDI